MSNEIVHQRKPHGLRGKANNPNGNGGFTGADDPRRAKYGPESSATAARRFGMTLRNMLVEEGLTRAVNIDGSEGKQRIQRVVERIYDEAELGEAWAVQLIFERIDGKITQPIENVGDIPVLVIRGASMDDV